MPLYETQDDVARSRDISAIGTSFIDRTTSRNFDPRAMSMMSRFSQMPVTNKKITRATLITDLEAFEK